MQLRVHIQLLVMSGLFDTEFCSTAEYIFIYLTQSSSHMFSKHHPVSDFL